MNCYHDENGFKLDANGEGCFLILGRLMDAMNLDIIVKKQVHGQNSSTTEVYDSKLIGNNLWEYTLVLPDVIEENPFCEFIIDSLISSIENL
ncbi:MAG: hypothetical protein LBU74_07210 [Methanobacteriaceae archaeon]|nr:hypothetical protein [Candidatus Methanorudis spinitermitis]